MELVKKEWLVTIDQDVYQRTEFPPPHDDVVWRDANGWVISEKQFKDLEEQFQREILQPQLKSDCKSCRALAAMFDPTSHCRVVCEDGNDE